MTSIIWTIIYGALGGAIFSIILIVIKKLIKKWKEKLHDDVVAASMMADFARRSVETPWVAPGPNDEGPRAENH